jgi:hypothetical protein
MVWGESRTAHWHERTPLYLLVTVPPDVCALIVAPPATVAIAPPETDPVT